MDQVKRTYRTLKTDLKKTVRGRDGTDFKDQVGNAGDEAGRKLGNLGDDVHREGRQPGGRENGPNVTPERPM